MKKMLTVLVVVLVAAACEKGNVSGSRLTPIAPADFVGTWVSTEDPQVYTKITLQGEVFGLEINTKNEATGIYRRFDFTAAYQSNLGTEYDRTIRTNETLNGNPAEPRVSFSLKRFSSGDQLSSVILSERLGRE